MKTNSDPKSVTLTIRLVEDVDNFYWEPVSRRNAHRAEAWQHLTRKTDYLPCCLKTRDTEISEIEARLKRVAKSKGFKVHRHTKFKDKFILTHTLPFFPVQPEEIKGVDLKWSLWSRHEETWSERKQVTTWEKMKSAFYGTGPAVTVFTSPRKEIRHGEVTIKKGSAIGTFACAWDDAEDLAYMLETECDVAFVESLPGSFFLGDVGVERIFSLRARTFERLMVLIDDQEAELIKENEATWAEVEKIYTPATK